MKKKILSTILCLTMVMSLVACGTKEEPTSTPDSSVESTVEDTSTVEDVETSEEVDSDTQVTKDEVISDEGEVRDGVVYTIDDLRSAVPEDNFKISIESSGILMAVATSGSDSQISISYSFDDVAALMDMYNIGSDIYSYFDDGNGNVGYYHAVNESETDEDTSVSLSDDSFNTDFDSIVSIEYVETKNYEGATYDVVKVGTSTWEVPEGVTMKLDGVEVEDTVVYSDYYINTETKLLDYMFATDAVTGEVTVGKFELIDGISLPSDFTEDVIQEVTSDEIAGQLFGVIMIMAGAAYENGVVEDTTVEVIE